MNINVGKSICECRELTGKSNVWVAYNVGISNTYMSVLSKKAHCSTELVAKLAKAYGIDVIEFLKLGMKN